jgi:hypothetical protein
MPTGTGLDAQLGLALETTWGTPVTVTKFLEINTESLKWEPAYLEPTGLRVGQKYKRASRLVRSRETVSGGFEVPFATRTMGTLIKAALGSTVTTPTLVLGSAYKQVHNPGDFLGKSLTVQVGRPETSGTIRPHTYEGCKITGWEFSVSDGEVAKFSVDVDGQTELTATALATAAYAAAPVAELFSFKDVTVFKMGGTVSGVTELAVAGGTAVPATTVVKSFSLKASNGMASDRYGLGNLGQKAEQLENDTPTITGTIAAEFDRTTFYDVFKTNTTTAIELKLEGSVISGTDKNTIHVVCSAAKLKKAQPNVGGPDIVQATVEFECYSDEVNAPLMLKLISADSTAL